MANSRDFIDKLVEIGYPNAGELDSNGIDFLFHNKALEPFLNWICKGISSANVIMQPELTRYNQLVESGAKMLEVEELEELGTFMPDRMSQEVGRLGKQANENQDVETAKWRMKMYEKRTRILLKLKQRLKYGADRHSVVVKDRERLESNWAAAKHQLDGAIVDCECANISANDVQKSIDALLRKVFDVVRSSAPSSNVWFFDMDFDSFWKNSEDGAHEILARMEKAFETIPHNSPELLAAHTSTHANVKYMETKEQCLRISRQGHVKWDLTFYRTELKCECVKAVLAESRKILDAMDFNFETYNCWKSYSLSNEKNLDALQTKNARIFEDEIMPNIFKKCQLMKDVCVFSQWLPKREKIAQRKAMLQTAISQLAGIEARIRFVLLAVDVERALLNRTGGFIDAIIDHFQMEVKSFSERKRTMMEFNDALTHPISKGLQTVSILSKILGIDESRLLAVEKLPAVQKELAKLKENIVAQCDALDSKFMQEISLNSELDRSLNLLIASLWHDSATQIEIPQMTPPAIAQALNHIANNSQKVEQNLLAAIKDQQDKKMFLNADELLPVKRKLYAYFYVDPEMFKRALDVIGCKQKKTI